MRRRRNETGGTAVGLRIPRTSDRLACAFTLLELLAVIGIVAILVALIYPVYQRAMEGGRAAACVANLRQIGAGLNAYLGEHGLTMPELRGARASREDDVPVIDTELARYITAPQVFVCPADPKYAKATGTSYFWNVALNNQPLSNLNFLNLVADHSRIPIIADKEGFHPFLENKLNILYADGHATKDLKFWSDDPNQTPK